MAASDTMTMMAKAKPALTITPAVASPMMVRQNAHAARTAVRGGVADRSNAAMPFLASSYWCSASVIFWMRPDMNQPLASVAAAIGMPATIRYSG